MGRPSKDATPCALLNKNVQLYKECDVCREAAEQPGGRRQWLKNEWQKDVAADGTAHRQTYRGAEGGGLGCVDLAAQLASNVDGGLGYGERSNRSIAAPVGACVPATETDGDVAAAAVKGQYHTPLGERAWMCVNRMRVYRKRVRRETVSRRQPLGNNSRSRARKFRRLPPEPPHARV